MLVKERPTVLVSFLLKIDSGSYFLIIPPSSGAIIITFSFTHGSFQGISLWFGGLSVQHTAFHYSGCVLVQAASKDTREEVVLAC